MKNQITIASAQNFMTAAQGWLSRDEANQRTKLAYAIGKVMARVQSQLRIYNGLIEDLNVEYAATNEKGHVLKDEKDNRIYEPDKEKQRNKKQREIYEDEKRFEIESYYAIEIPDSLSGYERALMEGFVIVPPDSEEAAELSATLREVARERVRQDLIWGGPEHDDSHSRAQWINLIDERLAFPEKADECAEYRNDLIQIAALSVAAVESFDRTQSEQKAE